MELWPYNLWTSAPRIPVPAMPRNCHDYPSLTMIFVIVTGSCVNFRTTDCVSPLHEACLGGHAACVSVLLKHGANVNATTIDWNTPLFNACVSGSVDCLNLLLQHRASPHPVCDLASPIHEAAKRGHTKCVETLLSNGVSIDHNIKHLGTPLYLSQIAKEISYCLFNSSISFVLGASANSGKDLDSPLHIAAQTSNVEMVHLLIDFGANTRLVPANSALMQIFLQRRWPLSLMQLCRLCIRSYLGVKTKKRISELMLPDELKKFLLYL
uniref:SOCS box domain-containing protein n=1 Tax=Naja naja TaxID=35670 RepID=A0A8C6Y9X7_NAJNA